MQSPVVHPQISRSFAHKRAHGLGGAMAPVVGTNAGEHIQVHCGTGVPKDGMRQNGGGDRGCGTPRNVNVAVAAGSAMN